MGKGLTAAQRRAVTGSEPGTGRVTARPEVCAALLSLGLAVRHGRPGHHAFYLTPSGLALRTELTRDQADPATKPPGQEGSEGAPSGVPPGRGGPVGEEGSQAVSGSRGPAGEVPPGRGGTPGKGPSQEQAERGGFVADDGTGTVPPSRRRAAEVAAAWEGLVQIRAVLGNGATEVPAAWERDRPVHAISLALEAAGVPPARPATSTAAGDAHHATPGYQVTASPDPGLTTITWTSPPEAEQALTRIAALLPPRGWQPTLHRTPTTPYLLTSPRRA